MASECWMIAPRLRRLQLNIQVPSEYLDFDCDHLVQAYLTTNVESDSDSSLTATKRTGVARYPRTLTTTLTTALTTTLTTALTTTLTTALTTTLTTALTTTLTKLIFTATATVAATAIVRTRANDRRCVLTHLLIREKAWVTSERWLRVKTQPCQQRSTCSCLVGQPSAQPL
jgi:hypothetical protein